MFKIFTILILPYFSDLPLQISLGFSCNILYFPFKTFITIALVII